MKITDEEIKKICSPTIYNRGIKYYKEGRVHLKNRNPDSVTAAVDGEQLYNVHITFQNGRIGDYLCTCPYYQTMGSACKHIVAALKTRQAELSESEMFENENDLLASKICSEFERREKIPCYLSLTLDISPSPDKTKYFAGFDIICEDNIYSNFGIESFLNSLLQGEKFPLARNMLFSPSQYFFDGASGQIMDILLEAYENKAADSLFYAHTGGTELGMRAVKRLFPLLDKIGCEYIIDSVPYRNLPIIEDDPDIIVDVAAEPKNISVSIMEAPIALTSDGEWFFYENKIFKTSAEWRSWFMPLYRAMTALRRTRIDFFARQQH